MHVSQNDARKRRNAICEDSHARIMGLAALSAQVEEKFTRNFRLNGEMREKFCVYDPIFDEF